MSPLPIKIVEVDGQGASTKIEFITKAGKEASGFTLPAGSMFPLGCAIPNHTTLQHGMYFPPGSMVRSAQGVIRE